VLAWLLRARYLTFAAAVAALAVLVALDRHVRYDQSLTAFFPDGDLAVIDYQRASVTFGNDNVVFVVYDDPGLLTGEGMRRLGELAESIQPSRIDAVVEVQSLDRMPLFWEFDDRLSDLARLPAVARNLALRALRASVGSMGAPDSPFTVGGALRRAANGAGLDALREKITSHPLLRNTLVDASGRTAAVVVRLKPMEEQDPKATIAALRAAADGFAARHQLSRPMLVGPPVLLADGFTAIEEDGRRLSIVGMALIGLVTLSITHSLWWALVPMIAGWTIWRAAETMLALLNIRLSLSGGPLVAQIIVLTMPAASHLAIHFRDALRGGLSRGDAARRTLDVVSVPILWTAATGAVGYAALLTSRVVPVFQFGAVLAACTLAATLLTMALSPTAMMPPFPLEIPVRPGSSSRLADALNRLTVWVADHPSKIVIGTLVLFVPLALGMVRLDYESNYINAFKSTTRVRADYVGTEARIGGIGVVSLVVPAGETPTLAALAPFRALGAEVERLTIRGRPAVNQVLSPATVLDPEGKLARLPAEQGRIALEAKLDLIAAAPQGTLLRQFWSADADGSSWARLVMRVSEREPALDKEQIFGEALGLARRTPAFSDPTRPAYLTGLSYLLTQTTRGVVSTSWSTFLWSAAGIMTMLTLAFRGLALATLALLPALLSVGMVVGLTSWMGLKLDIATALVASVALGLSVDDTFHCLLQYKRRRATQPFRESLLASYQVSGPGVVLSSLAVAVGFAVLRFSEFVPFSSFGTMVGVATLGSSIGNLVLLPACLALGHRWATRRRATTLTRAGSVAPQGAAAADAADSKRSEIREPTS
jgi:predicted RND superfamily exporter protein